MVCQGHEQTIQSCTENPVLVSSGMAASRIAGTHTGWTRAERASVVLQFSSELLAEVDRKNLITALIINPNELAPGGAASDFLFVQQVAATYEQQVLHNMIIIEMGGIEQCWQRRTADYLEGGLLVKPNPEELKLMEIIPCHNDMSERNFGIMDNRTRRSASATVMTKSRYTLTVQNDTSTWRRRLPEELRDDMIRRARKGRAVHEFMLRNRKNLVHQQCALYLQELAEAAVEKDCKRREALVKSYPLTCYLCRRWRRNLQRSLQQRTRRSFSRNS